MRASATRLLRRLANSGRRLGAKALCCFTSTGDTALRLARQRSPLPLLAFTHDESVRARLAFSWGIESAVLAPATRRRSPAGRGESGLLAMGMWHPGTSSWWCPVVAAVCRDTPTRCACYESNDRSACAIAARERLEVDELGAHLESRVRTAWRATPSRLPALADLTHDRRYPDDDAGLVAQQCHAELDREPASVLVGGRHAQQACPRNG